jgi:arsenite methyltransferase
MTAGRVRLPMSAHRQSTALRALILLLALALGGCTALKRLAYEGFNRDEWQKPDEVIRALRIQSGEIIADLGSGSGYFTFRLARAVAPGGKVYAVDVDEGMNRYVTAQARERGLANIEVILPGHGDPSLPPSGVHMIFSTNTYHFLEDRAAYFDSASKYLRPGGRVVIIDFSGRQWFDIFGTHYTPGDVIKSEMKKAGYTLQQEFDFLPKQNFLVFSKLP